MGSDFRINLYRKEMMVDAYGVVDPKLSGKTDGSSIQDESNFGTQSGTDGTNGTQSGTDGTILNNTAAEERLISVIREDGTITQKQMSQRTGLSLRTIKRMTVELQKIGKIVRIGNSRSGKWQVKD